MTVTQTLLTQLNQQLDQHRVLVWYDPAQHYLALAESLLPADLADANIFRYRPDRGFVGLRHDLEPLWADTLTPPRLLIYVPRPREASYAALIEYEQGGAIIQPGQQPPEQNTDLAVVARHALSAAFPLAKVAKICAEVEAGQWTVAGLDNLIEKGDEVDAGVLADIFGSGNAADIVTAFLSRPELDAALTAQQAQPNLAAFLNDVLGVPFATAASPVELRARLARQLLFTDLLVGLGDNVPPSLKTFAVAPTAAARQAAVDLARAWRNRRDTAAAYVAWADKLQPEIGLSNASLSLPLDNLAQTETFAAGESRLQAALEAALVKRPTNALLALAESRRDGFWAGQKPALKTRWEVITDAARLLLEANRIEGQLKGKSWPAEKLLAEYALAEQPWCALDTAQRHLERDFHRFDLDQERHQSLHALVAHVRQRYATVANTLAKRFVQSLETQKFELPQVLHQSDLYHEVVAPLADVGRVAYLLVDALRFEMGRELVSTLEPGWHHDLTAALSTPPTITEVGMAALLPGAEQGVTLTAAGGKLAVAFAGENFKERKERVAHFATNAPGPVVVATLSELAPLSDKKLSQQLKAARTALITATDDIDGLCENNPALARRLLDEALNQLRRGLKTLFGLGFPAIVITADHGYLFGEKISSGQTIDAPGGQTAVLKRRVWVGQGGDDVPGTLRRPLSAFGLGGDLELVTPYNLSVFKVKGGATEYFHGGLSLPELVIPVLTVRSSAAPAASIEAPIEWSLALNSKVISSQFASVTISGQAREMFVKPPLVRVEIRAGSQPISLPVLADYNWQQATRDVQLEMSPDAATQIAPNKVVLQLTEIPAVESVTIHLLDAATGLSLYQLENVPFKVMDF
ncbi:MAG: PglZ domain-containing protein [Anaerolineae bacterium]